jgi:hypothetical protein
LSAQEPIVISEPKNAARFLSIWAAYGGEADVRHYLKGVFADAPEVVTQFIAGFLPTAFSATGSRLADFDRNAYDAAARLIDPSVLHDCILKLYGAEVSSPVFHGASDRPFNLTIAHQFEYVHNVFLAEAQKRNEEAVVNNAPDADTTQKKE